MTTSLVCHGARRSGLLPGLRPAGSAHPLGATACLLLPLLWWSGGLGEDTQVSTGRVGAVSGVVFDSASDRPIPGAHVSLTAAGPGRGLVLHAAADSGGRFVFASLPAPGAYTVRGSAAGYYDEGISFGDSLDQSRIDVSLDAGQWIANLRIQLSPMGSIRGIRLAGVF